MNILWNIHGYPPYHNAGAEWMAHDLNKHLIEQGHSVKVITRGISDQLVFEGVEIYPQDFRYYGKFCNWCDVIVTHLDQTGKSINVSRDFQKPLLHIIHNNHPYGEIKQCQHDGYVVYNSEWVAKSLNYSRPSIVCHPIINMDYYKVDNSGAEAIILINLWKNKGGKVLFEIAKQMPDKKFIGVKGGYGEQYIDESVKNVTILENTKEIRDVYKKARIVLMPSSYESWGRVACEAIASGIPVIAQATPGLKESLSDAGLFCDRDCISEWVSMIRKLDDEKVYKKVSDKCKQRAIELTEIFTEDKIKFELFIKSFTKMDEFKCIFIKEYNGYSVGDEILLNGRRYNTLKNSGIVVLASEYKNKSMEKESIEKELKDQKPETKELKIKGKTTKSIK